MGKWLIFLSLLSLLILELGTVLFPNNSAMWLAATTPIYETIRGLAVVGLISLLITNPPRAIWLRATVGVIAGIVFAAVALMTFTDTMQILDSLALASASVAMGLAVLEVEPATQTNEQAVASSLQTLRDAVAQTSQGKLLGLRAYYSTSRKLHPGR